MQKVLLLLYSVLASDRFRTRSPSFPELSSWTSHERRRKISSLYPRWPSACLRWPYNQRYVCQTRKKPCSLIWAVEPHPQYHRPQMRPYPITRQDRTMLQRTSLPNERFILVMDHYNTEAWHIVATTDPLIDSDEEHPDEHVRLDYGAFRTILLPVPCSDFCPRPKAPGPKSITRKVSNARASRYRNLLTATCRRDRDAQLFPWSLARGLLGLAKVLCRSFSFCSEAISIFKSTSPVFFDFKWSPHIWTRAIMMVGSIPIGFWDSKFVVWLPWQDSENMPINNVTRMLDIVSETGKSLGKH